VNQDALFQHITTLSHSQVFETARGEWDLEFITFEELDSCPCGQLIREKCWLHNRVTGYDTFVGNVCVNRFMGINTKALMTGLKRVKRGGNANYATINYWKGLGQITHWERRFLLDIHRKRVLSPKQASWKTYIYRKVVI
jgi:hypothetical protein